MNQNPADIGWKQRFQNFENAYNLLNDACSLNFEELNELEKEGVFQRFEYTFELAWKSLKDKMENDGIVLERISPKNVLRQAFQARYIDAIAKRIEMIAARNLMSHTYDLEGFFKILNNIKMEFLPLLRDLHISLKKEI